MTAARSPSHLVAPPMTDYRADVYRRWLRIAGLDRAGMSALDIARAEGLHREYVRKVLDMSASELRRAAHELGEPWPPR